MSAEFFSEQQALECLQRVRIGTDPDGTWINWHTRFALLATPSAQATSSEYLSSLSLWPLGSYRKLTTETRQSILSWLLENSSNISTLDLAHAWSEQWILELYKHQAPTSDEAIQCAKQLEKRPYSGHSERIFLFLEERSQAEGVELSWLRHLQHNRQWDALIQETEQRLSRFSETANRAEGYALWASGLLRRGKSSEDIASDADRAFHVLQAAHAEGAWNEEHERLLRQAVEAATPGVLKEGRAVATSIVGDAYRGLSRFGKWFGKALGGRDANVPHSESVIASAPSLLRPGAVEDYLNTSDRHRKEFAQAVNRDGGELEAAIASGAVTLGGAWTLSQIDSSVLDAMTFASSGNPDSFWELRDIASSAEGSEGAIRRLSGYVAEQMVARDLTRQGFEVNFPDGASEPGWDLMVDGNPMQVKCSLSADYVLEHFERYSDIPVIVNAELAEALGEHPLVLVDEALSHADVALTTNNSVEALADFADADDLLPIPLVSVAFAAYRNYGELRDGHIDELQFAQRVGVDATARTVGGGTGSVLGGAIGSVLGPVGTVLGAGIGGFIGSIAGGTGADAVNRTELCAARDSVVHELAGFACWFNDELLPSRIERLRTRCTVVRTWSASDAVADWGPGVSTLFYAAAHESLARAEQLHAWLSERTAGDDFARANAGWVALREASAFFHPDLKRRLTVVQSALDAYTTAAGVPSPQGSPAISPT